MALSVQARELDGRPLLQVAGELDMDSAATLMTAALAHVDAGGRDVVIDAGELSFCDSSGLSVFVRIVNRIAPTGGRLAIANVQPFVERVLEVSGLIDTLVVADTVDAAVKLLDSPTQP